MFVCLVIVSVIFVSQKDFNIVLCLWRVSPLTYYVGRSPLLVVPSQYQERLTLHDIVLFIYRNKFPHFTADWSKVFIRESTCDLNNSKVEWSRV